jgi:hypothetical protein
VIFIISTHSTPRFYKSDGGLPIQVDSIKFINEKDGYLLSPPVIAEPMQAISELYKAEIPCYLTTIDARKKAVVLKLTGFKYLKL